MKIDPTDLQAIAAAYQSGNYTLEEVGQMCGRHLSWVGKRMKELGIEVRTQGQRLNKPSHSHSEHAFHVRQNTLRVLEQINVLRMMRMARPLTLAEVEASPLTARSW